MKSEHIINRRGIRMVLYSGLLDVAHSRGLSSIDTEVMQIPDEENGNVAICHATVEMRDVATGTIKRFSGIGDASPENVGKNIIPHILRMSETRAKARALRDAINVAEALTDDESTVGEYESPSKHQAKRQGDTASELATEPQVYKLRKTIEDGGHSVEKFEQKHGSIAELSTYAVSAWIERLTPENKEAE